MELYTKTVKHRTESNRNRIIMVIITRNKNGFIIKRLIQ